MKAYVTKYALTMGILELEVEDADDGMIKDTRGQFPSYYHGEGKEWHRTREAAVKRAEVMRTKKIASIKKQLAKIENLEF